MNRKTTWSFVLCSLLFANPLWAANKVLFEGYYKIVSEGEHVGYTIQRYEIDPDKKQFISTYYLRTNAKGGNISESLKAYATETLKPLKYQYTSLQGSVSKTIDANVRKNKKNEDVLQLKVNENGKLRVSETKLDSKSFFSTFMVYLVLQAKEGLKAGVKYDFTADQGIAEEDGKGSAGYVFISSEEKMEGINTFKTLYNFKNVEYVNYITNEGQSLQSIALKLNLSAILVADPNTATAGQTFNPKSIALLFGDTPKGLTNVLSSQPKKSTSSTPTSTAPVESIPTPDKATNEKSQ